MKRFRLTILFLSSAMLCSITAVYVLPNGMSYSAYKNRSAAVRMGILGILLLAASLFAFVVCIQKSLKPDTTPLFSAICRHAGRLALTILLLLPAGACISLVCGLLAYILSAVLLPVALKTVVDSIAGILWLLFLPIFLYGGLRTLVESPPPTWRSFCGGLPTKKTYVRLLLWVSTVCVFQVIIHTVCDTVFTSSMAARLLQLIAGTVLGAVFIWRLLVIYQSEKEPRATAVVQ